MRVKITSMSSAFAKFPRAVEFVLTRRGEAGEQQNPQQA